jgi:O-antigen/teichoic acid export membrane protein
VEATPATPETPPARASATRAVTSILSGSLIIQALSVISGIELARGLGLTGRGDLAAAILWPTVIGGIGVLGLEESMTYHIASARDRRDVGRLLGSALALCAVQSVIFTAVTLIVVPIALHRHTANTITSGLIFTGFVSMNMFGLALNGTLNGLHRYTSYNAARVSIGIAIVTAQTILLIVAAFRVEVIVIAMMGCYALCLLFDCTLTYRARPGRLSVDRAAMRSVFMYGAKSHTSNTSSFLNQRLDQLVISVFLTSRELGIYVVAVTFTLFTSMLGSSIMVAALPNIASLDDPAEQGLLSRRLVTFTLLAAIVASLPVIVFAPLLIHLFFGPDFVVGANITRVTAVASISFATTRSLEGVLRGIGRPLTAGTAEFVALGATVVGLATLLPALGLIGAAWASLAAYTISGLWMAWRIRAITGMPMRHLLTPDGEGVAILREALRTLRGRLRQRLSLRA